MKVLMVHNLYRVRGGEDESFACESKGLEAAGHSVRRLVFDSSKMSFFERALLPLVQIWSLKGYREVARAVEEFQPDVVHFQNTFPLVSRSAYFACRRAKVPVVQSLRNFRFLCPGDRVFFPGQEVAGERSYGCGSLRASYYKGSALATGFLKLGNWLHRKMGTVEMDGVTYVAPSSFVRSQFVEGGWNPDRIRVKPNVVPPSGEGRLNRTRSGAVFVGRLSEEKGLRELLNAWEHVDSDQPLTIIGDGPLVGEVEAAAEQDRRIRYLGRLKLEDALQHVAEARVLVQLSNCCETFGRSIAEAFSVGTPVIASVGGAFEELVDRSRGGLLPPEQDHMCARAISRLLDMPEAEWDKLSDGAREFYRLTLSPDLVTEQLVDVYRRAINNKNVR
ncbi:glycosyltransferase [Sulfuriroseicoccus oceanibius]|uniref:Glycosyltransferase n=1 Tax=Sulfuriroseicoccus oceanibius TaxID=2707525 RepID=A0A6B3LCL2_9BACT|nr:glycosyltransferase [Sulfuriroseicoccus oceanibius]QQL45625.1 glycosyltransferase [Sulfuriroseicoccus oceanibius]